MQYSVIQKSQLEGAKRLDAEYYQPEYLAIRKKLFSSPVLDEISKKITDFGAYSQMNFVEYTESGVRFFRNQDIGESFIEDNEPIYISADVYKKLSLKLEEYDILTPRVGTIGTAAVIFKEYLPASANQNLAQIKPDITKIDPVYLSVFLNSKFGHLQFDQFATGNVQPWLNLSQIKSIKVFVPSIDFQESVKILALQALQERNDSKSLYSQAENLLLEELGLKNFESENELWSVVNLSETRKANRIDAEYFQPKYEMAMTKIRQYDSKTIGELSELVGHATQSPYDEMGDIAVLAQKHMKRNLEIDTSAFDNYTKEDLIKKNDKKFILKKGDVLISSAGEPGLTSIWTDDYDGKVIPGSFVTIARFGKNIEPLYVGVFLNTLAGKLQFERDYTGSVQQYVYPSKIREILVPMLQSEVQQKIAGLVRKSHESRKKAKQLLEEAKQKVEELIEKQNV